LKFDTLRKSEYWPSNDHKLLRDSVGILYASPIDKATGIIGDFGLTIYRGSDLKIQSHLSTCLSVLEQAAEAAAEDMEFRELHNLAQRLFNKSNLTNARTVTWTDTVGTNLGHTIPWSYEIPTSSESDIISAGSLPELQNLISSKRVNVNQVERFKIPKNIAFTLEARLESSVDGAMPNTFYHLIIIFENGTKKVLSNFNAIFQTLGMDVYMGSKSG
jgi:hypothetical protein